MPKSPKSLKIEVAIVLSLSLGASAVYSVISLINKLTSPKGLGGSSENLNPTTGAQFWIDLAYQLAGLAFGVAPAALAIYLLWQISNRKPTEYGFDFKQFNKDGLRALITAAAIGIPGIGLYFTARALGLSAQIAASDYKPSVIAVILMLLSAVRAGILEEVIVVAYLLDRLERVGFKPRNSLLLSAGLRGSYHLYQGFGGFVGNFVMGLVFGWCYQRWGRVMPLVIAHSIMDSVVFVGYFFIPAGIL